jgi:hypothetical protein
MSTSAPLSTSAVPTAGAAPADAGAEATTPGSGQTPLWRSGFVLILGGLVLLAYWLNPPLDIQPQAGVVMNLPVLLGDYFGKEGEITATEHRILPQDTEFARRFYDDGHGHQVNCTIVLSGAEDRSIHRPEACLEGQGWKIMAQDNLPITLTSGHPLVARRLSVEQEQVAADGGHYTLRGYYIYWFVGQNVTTPSHFTRLLLSNWDRAVHNRAHRWAYVSFFSIVSEGLRPDGLSPAQTQTMMTDFIKQVVPTFQISEMPAQARD